MTISRIKRLAAVAVFAAAACTGPQNPAIQPTGTRSPISPTVEPTESPASVTIRLQEQEGSGQRGTATLSPEGGKTRIDVALTGGGSGVKQPIHVHAGRCGRANLGAIVHDLGFVADGRLAATAEATLDSLLSGDFAINVHKSQTEPDVYVACGEIED